MLYRRMSPAQVAGFYIGQLTRTVQDLARLDGPDEANPNADDQEKALRVASRSIERDVRALHAFGWDVRVNAVLMLSYPDGHGGSARPRVRRA